MTTSCARAIGAVISNIYQPRFTGKEEEARVHQHMHVVAQRQVRKGKRRTKGSLRMERRGNFGHRIRFRGNLGVSLHQGTHSRGLAELENGRVALGLEGKRGGTAVLFPRSET